MARPRNGDGWRDNRYHDHLKQCLYARCQQYALDGCLFGFSFCDIHIRTAARAMGWPVESLLKDELEHVE